MAGKYIHIRYISKYKILIDDYGAVEGATVAIDEFNATSSTGF